MNSYDNGKSEDALGVALLNWVSVAFLAYLLFCAVGLIEVGFETLSSTKIDLIMQFATNPVAGVLVGVLATALVQSSSAITAVLVGMVAGGLPLSIAIPVVIGANFGTTITNSIVSLGFARNKADLKRAFAAATVHDAFNLLCLFIFLGLQISFGVLEKLTAVLAYQIDSLGIYGEASFIPGALQAITHPFVAKIQKLTSSFSPEASGAILCLIGLALIVFSMSMIGQLLRSLLVGKARRVAQAIVGKNLWSGIGSGLGATMLLQSSSSTTSFVIPLAASGAVSTKGIYPFTIGANIGTCITAILAAFAVVGDQTEALELALVHLSYNVFGALIILAVSPLRYLPVRLAEKLADVIGTNVFAIIAYIICVFLVIPAAGIWIFSS
ncbi:Na/Pi cotransporter family protein [Rhodobacteraceae bacterium RKSG542]|uniref:Na/Pi symporter n=1 Tax=Pseudovibrio flavus TaxID=2529854 RepID=UPI0012BC7112|nr:Na/Pi symporter [Pseudovibrio flavus]MTI15829.1 Na/Pi cotransporter family protein [Pseudovibrio flavus]